MLSLSPAKLLVVLVIALIVLGPDKLPQVARRAGALWADLRRWRARLESEVRGTFPDLPPTHEVVRAVRSPLVFLDGLADAHEGERSNGERPAAVAAPGEATRSSEDAAHGANGAAQTAAGSPREAASVASERASPNTGGWNPSPHQNGATPADGPDAGGDAPDRGEAHDGVVPSAQGWNFDDPAMN